MLCKSKVFLKLNELFERDKTGLSSKVQNSRPIRSPDRTEIDINKGKKNSNQLPIKFNDILEGLILPTSFLLCFHGIPNKSVQSGF